MNEKKKILCFNAKLNSDRYFNPESDAFKKTYIFIDNEKLPLKDLWEEHKQLQQTKEENERLKEENEELKKRQITKNGFICDCEQNVKYRQALEEIREITEQDRNCMNSELACCQCCDKLDLIKDIISEVLDERN